MDKPKVSKERLEELACFNGVGGSGRESEFTALMAPAMAKVVRETDLMDFVRPHIEKLAVAKEVACFNGVGGSGREVMELSGIKR